MIDMGMNYTGLKVLCVPLGTEIEDPASQETVTISDNNTVVVSNRRGNCYMTRPLYEQLKSDPRLRDRFVPEMARA